MKEQIKMNEHTDEKVYMDWRFMYEQNRNRHMSTVEKPCN